MSKETYTATIGIECHVQLKTLSKLFSSAGNEATDAKPNTLVSPLCFGLPGTLPVLNKEAVRLAIRSGLALGAEIAQYSKFDRKHYFYPDLPLGYQITQFDEPTILGGCVRAPLSATDSVSVRIHHAHLEADAGKSSHPVSSDHSLVDLNRVGTPLIEIVSEPDMHSAAEAKAYARELWLLMKHADVSDVNLYYGNMRFDVNVSVSKTTALGTRTETKNLNSFRSVEKAVEYEIDRQIRILEAGEKVIQETRGWDDDKQQTFSQRSKEDAHDYRYFPDPDLPPILIDKKEIEAISQQMPPMPEQIREVFAQLSLDFRVVEALVETPAFCHVLLDGVKQYGEILTRTVALWYSGEITRLLSDEEVKEQDASGASPRLYELAKMVESAELSSTAAKSLIGDLISLGVEPKKLAEERNLLQVSDTAELEKIINKVISENPKAAQDVQAGEVKAIGFLTGQVMKASAGKANPSLVQELIKKLLSIS